MNVNIKQKLAGKSAYVALALLLTMIVAFTVIAIVAAVNARPEEPELPPVSDGENQTPNEEKPEGEGNGDTQTGGEIEDEPPVSEPEAPVYAVPSDGYIQKDFSADTLVFSQTMNDHRTHLGIDIAGKMGDPVKAFYKGTVEKVYNDPFMGKTVIIAHENGMKSVYMNLANELAEGITEGVAVETGALIGAIGDTASMECADSPHLHFEIRLDGSKIDPKKLITLPTSGDSEDIYEG
jgi:murein DD-endopeptidase MepM/ murein hydrolase activator NlpD